MSIPTVQSDPPANGLADRLDSSVVVLNVDDYEAGRYATTRILRRAGFQVIEAPTGEDALRLAGTRPDLVVLDVNLPDVDGFEVCRRLKANPYTADIPVLYLSAQFHDTEHRVRGLEMGADAYLKQPAEPQELVATAHALLRARHVAAAVRRSEERFRSLVEAISQVVWTTGPAGGVAEAQPAWQAFTGQSAEEVLGGGWMEAVHPDDLERARAGWTEAVRDRTVWIDELRLRRADGVYRDLVMRAVPVLEDDGGVREWVGVGTDTTERRRVEKERDGALAAARTAQTEAEEANRAKSLFLANMSHEIRTPINAIIGYTELLELGITGPVNPEQAEQLHRVQASSQHLLGLVNEILDLAKVESGQMQVGREDYDLRDAVEQSLGLVEPQAQAGGITIHDDSEPGAVARYAGDESRVRQILTNLFSNAVKFTERGGRVHLTCGTAEHADPSARLEGGPWAYVRVEDTGWGIPAEHLEAIFEPFVQGESGHTRRKGGTGLGLAISRQFARLMGGDITVQSTPGVGSRFTLWLAPPGPDRL